jgi:hypothetical protein
MLVAPIPSKVSAIMRNGRSFPRYGNSCENVAVKVCRKRCLACVPATPLPEDVLNFKNQTRHRTWKPF